MSPERLEITRRKIANAMTECRFVVSIIPEELSWLLEQQAALTAATEENKRLKERVGELERERDALASRLRALAVDWSIRSPCQPDDQDEALFDIAAEELMAALNPKGPTHDE